MKIVIEEYPLDRIKAEAEIPDDAHPMDVYWSNERDGYYIRCWRTIK